jgi:hypothetical protein
MRLSSFARELEQAGKTQNTAFLIEKTTAFLSELRTVIRKFTSDAGEYETCDMSSEDMAYLRKAIMVIQEACAEYDTSAAKTVLDALKNKPWTGNCGKLLDTITECLLDSDFDGVEAVCAAFLLEQGEL